MTTKREPTGAVMRKGREKWVSVDGEPQFVATIRTDWKATCGVLKGYIKHLEKQLEAARKGDIPKGQQVHLGNWHITERDDRLHIHVWPANGVEIVRQSAYKDSVQLDLQRVYPALTPSAQRSADLCGND